MDSQHVFVFKLSQKAGFLEELLDPLSIRLTSIGTGIRFEFLDRNITA